MNSSALASFAASMISLVGGVGTAEGDVVADRPAQQHRLLQDEADLAAESVQPVVADVAAVDADGAGVEVAEPRDEADERRLAAAGGTDDADGLARLDGEGDVAQHRPFGVVTECDVLEFDLALERRRFDGHRSFRHRLVGVADRGHALEADADLGEGVGHHREVADRLEELRQVGQEDGERAGRHGAAEDQQGAAPQHDPGAHRDHQADGRRQQRRQLAGGQPCRDGVAAGLAQLLLGEVLTRVGLDEFDRLQALLQGGQQVGLARFVRLAPRS